MRPQARQGFTIIELLIVVAIIAIIAGVAVPRLLGARLTANETSAIATMRSLLSAQVQTQAVGAIDTDSDGLAEFAYFGEMAGTVPGRISVAGAAAPGIVGVHELKPESLVRSLGVVSQGVVTHSGYVFAIFLPANNAGAGPVAGLAEDNGGGKIAAPFPDADGAETYFCAYGWPLRAGMTGNKVFFINQEGVILQTANRGAGSYTGILGGPAFDAVYTVPGDMGSPTALNGAAANDGHNWVPLQ